MVQVSHGNGVENCLQVMEMLGLAGDAQREARKAIEDFRARKLTAGLDRKRVPRKAAP